MRTRSRILARDATTSETHSSSLGGRSATIPLLVHRPVLQRFRHVVRGRPQDSSPCGRLVRVGRAWHPPVAQRVGRMEFAMQEAQTVLQSLQHEHQLAERAE